MGGSVPPIGVTGWPLNPFVPVVLDHAGFGDRWLVDDQRLTGKGGGGGHRVHAFVGHGQLLAKQPRPVL